jgi:single-strand DNA-binding protein
LNKFIGLGNLTRDPDFKNTKSGKAVCNFSLAINNKANDSVTFVDIETWSKTAENCSRFLSKGRKVVVEGRLQLNTWNSKSGEARSKLFCIADQVTFLDKSNDNQLHRELKSNQLDNPLLKDEEDEFADVPF